MSGFQAGLDGVTFTSNGRKLLGGFYRSAGTAPRPTAVLLHGTPGLEKHLDIAYRLRDLGWNCLYFHFRGSWGSEGPFSFAGLPDDAGAAVDWALRQPSVDKSREDPVQQRRILVTVRAAVPAGNAAHSVSLR